MQVFKACKLLKVGNMYLNRLQTRKAEALLNKSLSEFPNIDKTGSILGMIKLYNWKRGATVRSGSYIYNIGVENIQKLKDNLN